MIIGVPKEVKPDEYRIAMLPVGAQLLVQDGHTVIIEKNAGLGSGFSNDDYADAGAEIIESAEDLFRRAQMIVKVKEPQPDEIGRLRANQVLFCYFHFASSHKLTLQCMKKNISAVAYETLTDEHGRLPLLTPMSEVAGKLSIQEGAKCLEKPMMGRGILLGGVPGVPPANVLVLGGGVVGINAARVAAGLGANVTIMDINLDRLRQLDEMMPPNVTTVFCEPHAIERYAVQADLVVGSVLIPGARAPKLISRELVSNMKKGSVIVDVCIDQGGCSETSRPTTHGDPVYVVDEVVHYCVTNMPGAVGRTSSSALCNATLAYCRELASLGLQGFLDKSPGRAAALNMQNGRIICTAVAEAFPDLENEVRFVSSGRVE
ncbi:alanine dehydrogenase [Pontiella agarivorans]|uniref:Alanine dehydrogenase n=1 Tax=Pontiella agarivorans TaxID=3038953 RepID=A0ABU5N1W7_9BACT|nr:alanine dehydrogenase [Pontiella agarivorans]MDZ8120445.1 alanine dehydrogenase [Pontiella agarivorans]